VPVIWQTSTVFTRFSTSTLYRGRQIFKLPPWCKWDQVTQRMLLVTDVSWLPFGPSLRCVTSQKGVVPSGGAVWTKVWLSFPWQPKKLFCDITHKPSSVITMIIPYPWQPGCDSSHSLSCRLLYKGRNVLYRIGYCMVISLYIWSLQILGDHRRRHEPNQDKSLQT
jgi:hypothetical protein